MLAEDWDENEVRWRLGTATAKRSAGRADASPMPGTPKRARRSRRSIGCGPRQSHVGALGHLFFLKPTVEKIQLSHFLINIVIFPINDYIDLLFDVSPC